MPSAPEPPVIKEVRENSVKLAWQPPPYDGDSPITGYIIERVDLSGENWYPVNKEPITGNEFTIENLHDDRQYQFRVRAQNDMGVGEASLASDTVRCRDMKGELKIYNPLCV